MENKENNNKKLGIAYTVFEYDGPTRRTILDFRPSPGNVKAGFDLMALKGGIDPKNPPNGNNGNGHKKADNQGHPMASFHIPPLHIPKIDLSRNTHPMASLQRSQADIDGDSESFDRVMGNRFKKSSIR